MFVSRAPWHNDVVLEFLERYRDEQVLWNPKHRDYKNKPELSAAWQRIQEAMSVECTVLELKKKKESLMTAYRLLVRKIKMNPEYQTSWFAYELMDSFLGELYKHEDEDNISTQEVLQNLCNDGSEEQNLFSRPIKRERQKSVSNKYTPPLQKRAVDRSTPSYSYIKFDNNEQEETDECDLYAQLLARKMRKLDERQRDIAMHEIDNIMFRAKMNSNSYETPNKRRKVKSPVFIVTEQNDQFEEEYLEDPVAE